MKRIYSVFMLFFLYTTISSEAYFKFVDFGWNTLFTLPSESAGKEKSLFSTAGLKLVFENFEARGYSTLPKTTFDELKSQPFLDNLEKPRYGAALTLFKDYAPVTIKAGSLSFSRSFAKLRNPAPSSVANPLTLSFGFSPGLGAVLPSLSSTVQPLSVFASCSFTGEEVPVGLSVEGFMNEDSVVAFSTSAKVPLSRFVSFSAAFTGAKFYIENKSPVLKKANADFDPDWLYAGLAELSFRSPFFKLNLYTGVHQSPYENNSVWVRTDARTGIGPFSLGLSYFVVPTVAKSPKIAPLIGGSSSVCHVIEQGAINPQLMFLFHDENSSVLRVGCHLIESWKVTANKQAVQLQTLKIRNGIAYENNFWTVRADWALVNYLLAGNPPNKSSTPEKYYDHSLTASLSTSSVYARLKGSYSYYPPYDSKSKNKQVFSVQGIVSPDSQRRIFIQGGWSMSMKDSERTSGVVSSGITFKFRRKYVHSSIKCAFEIPY